MSCWNPRVEMMPGDELHGLQLKLLKSLVYRLYSFSPFYRERMDAAHVSPDDIRTLEDVEKLPFMAKGDLRDIPMEKLFIASNRELVRYHASSGTTGKPTIVGYTKYDVDNWSESIARGLMSCGITQDDTI